MPWTAELAEFSQAIKRGAEAVGASGGKELWFEGTMSPEAVGAFEELGWVVNERVGLLVNQ
jgi:hypothetical protein